MIAALTTVGPDSADIHQSAARRFLRRFLNQGAAVASLCFLVLLAGAAVFAPVVAPYPPEAIDALSRLQGPSAAHWLGTDELGRDVYSRIIFGARVAFLAACQAVGIGIAIGVPAGLAAGYRGGVWDNVAMRVIDVLDAIPGLLFALAVIAALGAGLSNAMLAIGLLFSGSFMRLTRAAVLAEREELYIDAAKVIGLRPFSIVIRHVLPNVVAPLIVMTSVLLGAALLIEAMLSFLGLGIEAGTPSWGNMLEASRMYQHRQPFLVIPAGVALTLTVLAFNLLGDGLRDAFGREPNHADVRRLRTVLRRRTAPGAVSAPETPAQAPEPAARPLLDVRDLAVSFVMPNGLVGSVAEGVSFDVQAGAFFGLVGESGCGKSTVAAALAGLLPPSGAITAGSVKLAGRELSTLSEAELRRVRGREMAFIFQDPVGSLSPTHQIRTQLCDSIRAHERIGRRAAEARAIELLDVVGIPNASQRLSDYPHQFSGGMAQRVAIAMALASSPKLLIADEPTTALDVTVQRRVLELLDDLRGKFGLSILLITHDLGVVAEYCDSLAVMYAGQIVEIGATRQTLLAPRHPYTAGLLAAMPELAKRGDRLSTVKGAVPPPWAWPAGCRFSPRCDFTEAKCQTAQPEFRDGNRCIRAGKLELSGVEK